MLPSSKPTPESVFDKKPSKDKKKMKNLPASEQRIREAQRVEAVNAYRMMKAKKMQATQATL
jgi:hypothetical protein